MNEYDSPQTVRIVTRSRPPSEVMDEAAAEIERLRLTDAERFVLREVCDTYANEDDIACNEIAAVIDGLLERTK